MNIWKFELEITDKQSLLMPQGAEIISAQTQNEIICIWAICNPDNNKEYRSKS